MTTVRRQLTLFAAGPTGDAIERVRAQLDPVQHALIAAHVTLCREDEIEGITVEELGRRLGDAGTTPLTLTFGAPEAFSGHGVLLPCVDGEPAFHHLRTALLATDAIRRHAPHITLAHPRNPRADANVPGIWSSLVTPITLTFDRVDLIEQVDGGVWCPVHEHPLGQPSSPGA